MNSAAAASSATYRKVNNALADAVGVEPNHTQYPSGDFERLAKSSKKRMKSLEKDLANANKRIKALKKGLAKADKKRLLESYKEGLRRGYITACDSLINPDGELSLKGGELFCDSKHIKIRARMKVDREWHVKTFDFHRKELEFEDA